MQKWCRKGFWKFRSSIPFCFFFSYARKRTGGRFGPPVGRGLTLLLLLFPASNLSSIWGGVIDAPGTSDTPAPGQHRWGPPSGWGRFGRRLGVWHEPRPDTTSAGESRPPVRRRRSRCSPGLHPVRSGAGTPSTGSSGQFSGGPWSRCLSCWGLSCRPVWRGQGRRSRSHSV